MLSRLQLYIILGMGALVLLGSFVYAIRRDAQKDLAAKIERQNNAAGDTSDRYRNAFDLCPPGMWDFGARKCRRVAPGGGH
ncbi:hypothetical protein [Rhizobium phage RHph_X3_2]|nr:hypothetical protein [Rhizobium phage RHph_X3_2]